MKVLTDIFGVQVQIESWDRVCELPLFIAKSYKFSEVRIKGCKFILISPAEELVELPALKKQMKRIEEIENLPVAICLSSISLYRRKKMIENGIPFLTEKQAFLPFIGTYLTKEIEEKRMTKLQFSTQQLFLLYFYTGQKMFCVSDATKILPFTSMTMSRAVKQLELTGCFQTSKIGVKKIIESKYAWKELYVNIKSYLNSPVCKTGYLDKNDITEDMVIAGESALAEVTMLNPSNLLTYAVYAKNLDKKKLMTELIDPKSQVKIELWEYDPKLFAENGIADKLSVALSFIVNEDERIETAIEELLEGVWNK